MATVNQGRVGFVPKGEYSASIEYVKFDTVTYGSNTYVAWATVTGVTPGTDETKWKLLVNNNVDIEELKSQMDEDIKTEYKNSYMPLNDIGMSTGGVDPTAGTNLSYSSNPSTCKIGYTSFGMNIIFICTDPAFEYNLWGYSAQSTGSKIRSLTNNNYVPAGTPVVVPYADNIHYFRAGFRKKDGTTVEASYLDTLKSFIEIYSNVNTENLGKEKYRFFQRVTGTTQISALTVINGYLFVFRYVDGNTESSDNSIYFIQPDGSLRALSDHFTSNIGHQNTVDYCADNKCLIASRYPEVSGESDFCVYLIHNVDESTRAFDVTSANTVTIDLSAEAAIGHSALNTIWAQNDLGKYDMAYVLTRDDATNKAYISLFQFGKGSNDLGNGTMLPGKSDSEFNGTYSIIKTLERTMETIAGIVDHNNDACYFGGKIYELPAPTSTAGLPLMIHSFENFGTTIKTDRIMIEHRAADGALLSQEKEGIAIYKNRLYVGSHSAGLFVYEF